MRLQGGFSEKRYKIELDNGETRHFKTEKDKKRFEEAQSKMKYLDKLASKKTGSPFEKE